MELNTQLLSEITTFMKYSKYIPELKRRETWEELVIRNQNMHIKKFPALTDEIYDAYDFVLQKKILPSMRSLQFAGKPIDLNPARIFNCSFMPVDHPSAFSELMFLLLSGVGVGYSVQAAHIEKLPVINKSTKTRRFVVDDSIVGWADAVKVLVRAYFEAKPLPVFDFSDIRPKGARLITSGGKAPGPEPLKDCLHNITKIFDRKSAGELLTSLDVHDICCYIADAVLAGGIRRCLPTYYSVKMSDGTYKMISTLKEGDLIAYNGKSYPVTNVYHNGVQDLLKINLGNDTWHISTANHKWLIMNHESNSMEWMTARVIQENLGRGMLISFVSENK
jgi:hypothetical protein